MAQLLYAHPCTAAWAYSLLMRLLCTRYELFPSVAFHGSFIREHSCEEAKVNQRYKLFARVERATEISVSHLEFWQQFMVLSTREMFAVTFWARNRPLSATYTALLALKQIRNFCPHSGRISLVAIKWQTGKSTGVLFH